MKGWMDERSMQLWTTKAWTPYVANYSYSVLILDDFSYQYTKLCTKSVKALATDGETLSGAYTCVLQPFDAGTMCFLMHETKNIILIGHPQNVLVWKALSHFLSMTLWSFPFGLLIFFQYTFAMYQFHFWAYWVNKPKPVPISSPMSINTFSRC